MTFLKELLAFYIILCLGCAQRSYIQRPVINTQNKRISPINQAPKPTGAPCANLIGGKFCKDTTSYPKGNELSTFGKQQSGRSLFLVDDPFWQPPRVRFCRETYEILAPRWALNQNGEGRYIVQNDDFIQKVFFRYCINGFNGLGSRCYNFGNCDQQYNLIQLRVYDDVYGIFSDWFQVPSGCYCKSN